MILEPNLLVEVRGLFQDHRGPANRVFCTEVGGTFPKDTLRKALYAALSAAGLDRKAFPAGGGFRFHDLRHTYGTLAIPGLPRR